MLRTCQVRTLYKSFRKWLQWCCSPFLQRNFGKCWKKWRMLRNCSDLPHTLCMTPRPRSNTSQPRTLGRYLMNLQLWRSDQLDHNALDAHLYFPASQSKQPELPMYCLAVQEREKVLTGWGLLLWGES